MEQSKRVPYGVSNFVDIIERNQYYVDKTMYLPLLEKEADALFFIRPRRFGKSLLISMMRAYYDISMTERFQELFGNLWIGSHPTPQQGKYQVLYLDFSKIGGGIKLLEDRFNDYCGQCVDFFVDTLYKDYYTPEAIAKIKGINYASGKLNALAMEAQKNGYQLFLIVDEYDNFTNVVLNEHGEDVYWALTHASGFYREIFKVFKGMFARIFMTGVSLVTLDDLTSGFNIGWHISTKAPFNQMLGFSTEDVRDLFTYYKNSGDLPADTDVEAIIEDMKPWYDNYCFSEEALRTQSKVFNCDMVLYYLRNYMETGEAPRQMIDPNTKTDYNKLRGLIKLDKIDGDRKGVMLDIIEKGEIKATLEPSFSAMDMTKPTIFPSLLFYYGMLTIKDTIGSRLILGIPNNNVRKQYYNYILEEYDKLGNFVNILNLRDYFDSMAVDGNWRDTLQYMADCYKNLSSVRDCIEGERNIQGFFLAYLNLNDYYYTAPEVEVAHGYCDFFMLPNLTHYHANHSYILELKYMAKKDYTEESAEEQWQKAVEQINGYAAAPRVEALRQGTQMHKIIMQFAGWDLLRMEEV